MSIPTIARGTRSVALGVALLAAALMLTAGTSQADRGGGRGADGGGRGGSGHWSDHGGRGGSGHWSDRGGRGDGGRAFDRGGGGRAVDGGGRGRFAPGGRRFDGPRYYGGPRHAYRGGVHAFVPYRYHYARPRSFVSFGIGLGLPYYCPPAYREYVEPYPVMVEPGASIEVDNYPPVGCYYYDPFCSERFANLDDYTDHIQNIDHPRTIDIVQQDSGERLRTLEFVGGYWQVMR
jgi:hypothetical protein